MKGGVTKKIEDTLKALDDKQLKKALYLTENNPKLQRQHQWLVEAAQTCLANKDNKNVCEEAIKMARDKIKDTVSLPLDDSSLEGLEAYLPGQSNTLQEKPAAGPAEQKSDEEAYEECEECHVAVAAAKFADICAEKREETNGCELIGRSLENEETEPVDWLKAMIQTAEEAQGSAKQEMAETLTELTDYLERRKSSFLEALDKETKCPTCGGPLDQSGCCPKCNVCPIVSQELPPKEASDTIAINEPRR